MYHSPCNMVDLMSNSGFMYDIHPDIFLILHRLQACGLHLQELVHLRLANKNKGSQGGTSRDVGQRTKVSEFIVYRGASIRKCFKASCTFFFLSFFLSTGRSLVVAILCPMFQKQPNGPETGVVFYRFFNSHSCTLCMELLRFPLTHL